MNKFKFAILPFLALGLVACEDEPYEEAELEAVETDVEVDELEREEV